MSIATFRVKRQRPRKLSDPYSDFAPSTLVAILSLPDDKLSYIEYQNILGPTLPAGTYRESVYFLPGAFRYVLAHQETDFLIPAIIGFISKNAELLAEDRLLNEARACIREWLDTWTQTFEIRNLGKLDQAIEALVRWETHVDIANEFVQSLADHGSDTVKATWFLAYAGHEFREYGPSDYSPIVTLLTDYDRLQHAVEIVKPIIGDMPEFWQVTFHTLGLDLI